MRGVEAPERELLQRARRICTGIPSNRPPNTNHGLDDLINKLVAQGRMHIVQCSCGRRHPYTTAEGKQALLLDALARTTQPSI